MLPPYKKHQVCKKSASVNKSSTSQPIHTLSCGSPRCKQAYFSEKLVLCCSLVGYSVGLVIVGMALIEHVKACVSNYTKVLISWIYGQYKRHFTHYALVAWESSCTCSYNTCYKIGSIFYIEGEL